jgi:RNA polymerase sigma-70 factor (ECF subfamily)
LHLPGIRVTILRNQSWGDVDLPALSPLDTNGLIAQARAGDAAASAALLERHRTRLRRMISVRMDARLRTRLDPSDVVQDSLAVALRRLPQYLHDVPLPFYPWLRQIAWNRLVDLHRRHIQARSRSVQRENADDWPLSAHSLRLLADRLSNITSTPSARLLRDELRQRVQAAMEQLPEPLREVLVLRQLEELSVQETAAALGVPEGTVMSRHFRALARLRDLLEDDV